MGKQPPAPEIVAQARELYEVGMSLRDTGSQVGVSGETVRRWAAAGGWIAPEIVPGAERRPKPIPSAEEIEAARLRADKAQQEARARWGVNRSKEADEVGADASLVRAQIMTLLKDGQVSDARQAAHIYATFINSANLLSGDVVPGRGRQGDEDGPSVHGPRPTDPAEMAKAGAARALQLVRPTVDVASREA